MPANPRAISTDGENSELESSESDTESVDNLEDDGPEISYETGQRLIVELKKPATTPQDIINFMSVEKIDINAYSDHYEQTLVYILAENAPAEIFKYFIHNCNPSLVINALGNLFEAAITRPENLEFLADQDRALYKKFSDQTHDIHAAVVSGDLAAFSGILKHTPSQFFAITSAGKSIFFWAGITARYDVMDYLLRHPMFLNLPKYKLRLTANTSIFDEPNEVPFENQNKFDLIREAANAARCRASYFEGYDEDLQIFSYKFAFYFYEMAYDYIAEYSEHEQVQKLLETIERDIGNLKSIIENHQTSIQKFCIGSLRSVSDINSLRCITPPQTSKLPIVTTPSDKTNAQEEGEEKVIIESSKRKRVDSLKAAQPIDESIATKKLKYNSIFRPESKDTEQAIPHISPIACPKM
jgi:hypothetical protein